MQKRIHRQCCARKGSSINDVTFYLVYYPGSRNKAYYWMFCFPTYFSFLRKKAILHLPYVELSAATISEHTSTLLSLSTPTASSWPSSVPPMRPLLRRSVEGMELSKNEPWDDIIHFSLMHHYFKLAFFQLRWKTLWFYGLTGLLEPGRGSPSIQKPRIGNNSNYPLIISSFQISILGFF